MNGEERLEKMIMVPETLSNSVGTYGETLYYSNKTDMVMDTKLIEEETMFNSEVANSVLHSKINRILDTANITLLCMENKEFLFERKVLSETRVHEILTESNSAIIKGIEEKKKEVDKIMIKNKDIVDPIILKILLDGEKAFFPEMEKISA